ncbi:MAG: TonB-dependent receptor [Prevotellaceae bacterium]|jgi:TonB-linked SusC/RagA family outer membrane protein|nr:TonB-dependent receptor [Prevotellaceae bacterium]
MKKFVLIFIAMYACFSVQAQQKPFILTGTVTDAATGEIMPDATVYVKDKVGIGTSTNSEGKYSIRISTGDVLVVSFVGYEPFEAMLTAERKELNVELKSSQQMEEVVVMGVGSKRKITSVGAVSTVSVSELQIPTTSVANLLGGKVAGIITMQTSGEPGKNIADFWVRGIGTFGANSSALVLIDGLEGDINSIDPADIESFSVLKDASATSIYGSRGANGVVIITTKKGETGKLKIDARYNYSLSQMKRMPEYLRAYDYALLANEAKEVRGDSKIYNDIELDIIKRGLDPDMYPDVDWQSVTMNPVSYKQSYYISARGGGEVARYFLSLGGSNESAAYKYDKKSPYASNVGYNTYNFRTNLDLSLTSSTSVYFATDGFLSVRNEPGIGNTNYIWEAQSSLHPLLVPVTYSNGYLPAIGNNGGISPYVIVNHTGRQSQQEFKGRFTIALTQDLSMLVDGLKLSAQGAYDIISNFNERRYVLKEPLYRALGRNGYNGNLIFFQTVNSQSATYDNSTDQYRKYYFKPVMNFNRTFAENHRVSVLMYYEISDTNRASDAFNGSLGVNANLRSIPKRYQAAGAWFDYSFRDTYMLNFNFGYNGTENFQPGRQYAIFPAIGVGWAPSSYKWVKERLPFIDFFKVKFTLGAVGNDVSNRRFPYLTMVSRGYAGIFGGNSVEVLNETFTGADNLEWERSVKTNLGFEGKFFNEKFTFNIDFFNDQRLGIFQERLQVPEYVGLVNRPYGNVGKMVSFGSDGNAAFYQELSKNASIQLRGNFSYSRNMLQNYEQLYNPYEYMDYNGFPYGAMRGFKAIGLFRDEDDILYSPAQTWNAVMPGDIKYMDVNGDGKIDDNDKVPLSYSDFPMLMYGFGGEFRYKNLTVGVMFKGTGKTEFYRVSENEGRGYLPFRSGDQGNILTIVNDPKNRWIPRDYAVAHGIDPALAENPNAIFPRLQYGDNVNNRQLSDFWKGDRRYLRLQEVTVNYNFKHSFLKKCGISSIDFQLIGTNLYVWDSVKLFDPEQARYNGLTYPIPATYSIQLYVHL